MNIAATPNAYPAIGIARPPVVIRRYSARDLLTTLFYYRRIMVCAFIVPVALGLVAAWFTKPAFVGQARLLVLYGSEYFYQPTGGQPGSVVALDRNEITTSELEVLKSTELAMQTLQTVGVDRVYPGTKPDDRQALEAAARRFGSDLSLSSIAQSNILEVSFRSYSPQVATDVLRALLAGYLADRVKVFQRSPPAAVQAEQDAFLARVRASEEALSNFAEAHGIANLDQQTALLLQQQAGNSQARDEAAQAVSETAAELGVIQQQLASTPPIIQAYAESDRSQSTQVLTDSLLKLQMKRRDLAARYSDSFPEVQSVDREIQWVQAEIASAPARQGAISRNGPNPVYQDLQRQAAAMDAKLKGLQARQTELASAATAIATQIRDLTAASREYRDLKRTRDVLDEAYRDLVKSNEAQIASSTDGSRTANIRVVQPPEASGVKLNMRLILAVAGVVLGLVAALAAMTVCNAVRQVYVTVRDVSLSLELPVLAAVEKRSRRSLRSGAPPPRRATQGA